MTFDEAVETVLRTCAENGLRPDQMTRSRFASLYGSCPRAIAHAWGRVKATAIARAGVGDPCPPGFHVRGLSTLTRTPDGELQWVKADRGRVDPRVVIDHLADHLADLDLSPRPPVDDAIDGADSALLAVYPMGDPHIGLYSAAKESGFDWSIERATDTFRAAIDTLTLRGTPAAKGLLINLGDGVHADRDSSTTKGTPVDTDGRWWEAITAAVDLHVYMIDRMLEVHEDVECWMVAGNHDRYTAFAIALVLSRFYAENKRVSIPINPGSFWFRRHGKVLLGATHGDAVSPTRTKDLALLMADLRREDWGQTEFRRWMLGHVHHRTVKEVIGCEVETFRSLARADAWHARQGYRSQRDMRRITFHEDFGEVEVQIVGGFDLERFEK